MDILKKYKKLIFLIVGFIVGIIVSQIEPPKGLTSKSMITLGTTVTAIIFWIFEVLPDFATSLLLCASWVLFKVVPYNVAFSTFSDTSWWLIIGGLGIGVAATSTGLMKRIALHVMEFFPVTFKGQSLAIFLAGLVIAPFIPSTNAKGAIAGPLSHETSLTMGYKDKSNQSAGIFLAMFYGFICSCTVFLSATFLNYTAVAILPKAAQQNISWLRWLFLMLPWTIVFIVLCHAGLVHFFKPHEEKEVSKSFITDQINALGKMSKSEKLTLGILIITLLFWMLEKVTGISSAVVAVISLVALLGLNILTPEMFRKSLPWNTIVFIGSVMGLSTVIPKVGIDKWLGTMLSSFVHPLLSNPYIMVISLCVIIYLIRFIVVSVTASITLTLLIILPLIVNTTINPVVIAIIVLTSVNVWVIQYQNPIFLTAYSSVDGKMSTPHQNMIGSLIFMAVNIIGLLVSVPFWQLLGLI